MNAIPRNKSNAGIVSDDWHPTTTREHLQERARLLKDVRTFFDAHDILEVETPLLCAETNPDPNLSSMSTHYTGPGYPQGKRLYLQTSPEFAMKRLLASGNGSIYQICKAFRDGEAGRLHNPEFTLLEWYRLEYDYHMLMDEVEEFVSSLLGLEARFQRLTYKHAFERYTGLDPHAASYEALQRYVDRFTNIQVNDGAAVDFDAWLDLIMSHVVEPQLATERPTFIYDYPASKAALATVRNGVSGIAERFELFVAGIELANGFRELSNKEEQQLRFERHREQRQRSKMPHVPCADRLLAALDYGLPSCAGVALGLDRLLMIRLKVDHIKDILAFPVDRA